MFAKRLLDLVNVVFREFMGPSPKTLRPFLGKLFSIPFSFGLIFHIRGFPPFSGKLSVTSRLSQSMSVQSSLLASPDLMAVSLSS